MFWSAYVLLELLGLHWFSDFVMQTHWQATNKSKNWWALSDHVLTYSALMTAGAGGIALGMVMRHPWRDAAPLWAIITAFFFVTTFVTHFITDAITSRISSKRFAAAQTALQAGDPEAGQRWHDFFVIIGLDQLIHQATLLATLYGMVRIAAGTA